MPGKIEVVHHSLTDWDFQFPNGERSLDPVDYISPPSSLKFGPVAAAYYCTILCRIPATQCLPQGEFRAWFRTDENYFIPAMFRNQAPLGSADWNNCYMISQYFEPTGYLIRLHRRRADVDSIRDTTYGYHAFNEWIHYRTFWYNGKNPAEQDCLCVECFREVAGEWVKLGDTLYDTSNYFKDSAINRVGHHASVHAPTYVNFDDSEIWGPV